MATAADTSSWTTGFIDTWWRSRIAWSPGPMIVRRI
jgi:hypothetical protein